MIGTPVLSGATTARERWSQMVSIQPILNSLDNRQVSIIVTRTGYAAEQDKTMTVANSNASMGEKE